MGILLVSIKVGCPRIKIKITTTLPRKTSLALGTYANTWKNNGNSNLRCLTVFYHCKAYLNSENPKELDSIA